MAAVLHRSAQGGGYGYRDVDGSEPCPDRSRMPRSPRSTWWARGLTTALHALGALVGRDALRQLLGITRDALRPRAALVAENALLRQQLLVVRRQVARPRLTPSDRWWMVVAARATSTWEKALLIAQPATLMRWHRDPHRWWWARGSAPRSVALHSASFAAWRSRARAG
jgi:hypothetical protein